MAILRLCDKETAAVHPESTVAEAIRLMLARRVGAVVVVDANRVVGIFTERDVLKKLALSGRDPEKVSLRELMTTPVETAQSTVWTSLKSSPFVVPHRSRVGVAPLRPESMVLISPQLG